MSRDTERLRAAADRYAKSHRDLQNAREGLYRAIRQAAPRMSLRAIADATAMSHQRVAQILGYEPPPKADARKGAT